MFDQLYPGSAAYHNPAVVALAGRVNVQALRDALADVQAHHGALRTRLIETEDGLPEQVVEPTLPLDFHESHTGPETVDALVRSDIVRPFNMEAGPLWRTIVVHVSDGRDVVAVTSHHLISDGWSLAVLLGDIDAAYRTRLAGSVPLLAPTGPDFGSFVQADEARLHAGERERLTTWWRETLKGAPSCVALPARVATFEANAATVPVHIGRPAVIGLDTVARD